MDWGSGAASSISGWVSNFGILLALSQETSLVVVVVMTADVSVPAPVHWATYARLCAKIFDDHIWLSRQSFKVFCSLQMCKLGHRKAESIVQQGLRSSESGPVPLIQFPEIMDPSQSYVNTKSNGPGACENTLIQDMCPRDHHMLLLPLCKDLICKTCTITAVLEVMGVHEVEEIWLALETFAFGFPQQRWVPAIAWEVEGPAFAQIHWVGFWASVREHLASEALSVSALVVGARTGACWLKQTSFL